MIADTGWLIRIDKVRLRRANIELFDLDKGVPELSNSSAGACFRVVCVLRFNASTKLCVELRTRCVYRMYHLSTCVCEYVCER